MTNRQLSKLFYLIMFPLCGNINVAHLLSTDCMQDVLCPLSHSIFTAVLSGDVIYPHFIDVEIEAQGHRAQAEGWSVNWNPAPRSSPATPSRPEI